MDVESKYILELSVQELTDVVNAFCDTIVAAGYTPIVYSDYNKFTTEMDTKQIHYDIWLARYGADGTYEGRTIWQCTDKGHVKMESTEMYAWNSLTRIVAPATKGNRGGYR